MPATERQLQFVQGYHFPLHKSPELKAVLVERAAGGGGKDKPRLARIWSMKGKERKYTATVRPVQPGRLVPEWSYLHIYTISDLSNETESNQGLVAMADDGAPSIRAEFVVLLTNHAGTNLMNLRAQDIPMTCHIHMALGSH
ncbi:hypothetical protein C8Q76DRAFT_693644 [Earliella scabrosa]|nr:hypothetical protein C8Q76DRAFT_693644 [Earliella scabrosa]